jgi:hypothetical protein
MPVPHVVPSNGNPGGTANGGIRSRGGQAANRQGLYLDLPLLSVSARADAGLLVGWLGLNNTFIAPSCFFWKIS